MKKTEGRKTEKKKGKILRRILTVGILITLFGRSRGSRKKPRRILFMNF